MRHDQVRTTLLGLLTCGTLLACGSAWSGPLPAPVAACVTNMTVASFQALGATGCSEGDKTYIWNSSSASIAADTINITELTLGSGDVQHQLTISFGAAGVSAVFNGSLGYTVFMNSLAVGFAGIDSVTFDTTTNNLPTTNGLSTITPSNPSGAPIVLVSLNGSAQHQNTVGEPQQLGYLDTWNIPTGTLGSLASSQDTLIETKTSNLVPEPASLALVGLGLSALGFMRRRKQG